MTNTFVANAVENCLLVGSTIAEVAVVAAILKNKLSKPWLSLLCYELFRVINSITLRVLYIEGNRHAYKMLWWGSAHFFTAIQFWILLQLASNVFSRLPFRKKIILACVTLSTLIGCLMASWAPNTLSNYETCLMMLADRACEFSWCILFIFVFLGSYVAFGIRYTHVEASVLTAFGSMSLAELICLEIVSRYGRNAWLHTWTIDSAVYFFATVFLVFALFRLPGNIPGISIDELKEALATQQEELADLQRG